MSEGTFKLEELARRAGISPRTVRYYVQRGLLPPPAFRGKDTAYGAEHLVRLEAIKRLQADHLPLDAIAVAMAGRSAEALARLAREGVSPASGETAPPAPFPQGPWRRLELAPGLELHVADDAPERAHALAREIDRLVHEREAAGTHENHRRGKR